MSLKYQKLSIVNKSKFLKAQKDKKHGKNFLTGAMGAVLKAKKNFAAPIQKIKKQKEHIDELKVDINRT